jgi:hypothetical protein
VKCKLTVPGMKFSLYLARTKRETVRGVSGEMPFTC